MPARRPRLRHPLTAVTVRCLRGTRSIQVPLSPRAPRSPAPVQTVTIVRVSPSSQDNPLACRLYVKPDGSDLDPVLIGPILAGLSSPRRGLAVTGLILAAILEQREENHRPWRRPSTHRPRGHHRRSVRPTGAGSGGTRPAPVGGQLVRAQRPPGHRRDHRVLTRRWRPRPAAAGGEAARRVPASHWPRHSGEAGGPDPARCSPVRSRWHGSDAARPRAPRPRAGSQLTVDLGPTSSVA